MQDIWERMYKLAKEQYKPTEVSPFVYAHHVVCAVESLDGTIYTGICIEALCGCAERVALLNMFTNSGQTQIKRLIAFRDKAPTGIDGMPCGVCREFLMQLNIENKNTEIMLDFDTRETVLLEELMPNWWGLNRASN